MDAEVRATIWIPGRLPGQNEIVAAAKVGRHGGKYAKEKREWTDKIAWIAKAANVPRFQSARFVFLWVEKDRRRNPDNIAAGKKFILDGLVKAGVLGNDGWGEILSWSDTFTVDTVIGCNVQIIGI